MVVRTGGGGGVSVGFLGGWDELKGRGGSWRWNCGNWGRGCKENGWEGMTYDRAGGHGQRSPNRQRGGR